MKSPQSNVRKKQRKVPGFERLMAFIATANLILVLFNTTYVPARDFYFRYFPKITQWYDPIKGIEPHRETEKYIEIFQELQEKVTENGINSVPVSQLIEELEKLSINMINEDPFAIADKSGTLEKIKNRMRERVPNPEDSSKEAFQIFWTRNYLAEQGLNQELDWFEEEIISLIQLNYYRNIGENGEFITQFWKIDLPFMVIFAVEYLLRTYFISRRFTRLNWRDALFWRWYDIFLFLPFWRWLRAISVIIRLDQIRFLDLERVRNHATRGILTSMAHELTEIVVVQTINQLQNAIETGDLAQQILEAQKRRYIDLNNINEIEVIATRLVQTTVYKVLPQVQPDIEAILRYSLEKAWNQSPVYQQIQQIPGLKDLPNQMIEQLVEQLSNLAVDSPQSTYEAVKDAMEDPVGTQLSSQLVRNFGKALGAELQHENSLSEIESLLVAFLEEFKINYVQRVDADNYQQVLAEAQQLRQLTKKP